jgi:hypothetical protein
MFTALAASALQFVPKYLLGSSGYRIVSFLDFVRGDIEEVTRSIAGSSFGVLKSPIRSP